MLLPLKLFHHILNPLMQINRAGVAIAESAHAVDSADQLARVLQDDLVAFSHVADIDAPLGILIRHQPLPPLGRFQNRALRHQRRKQVLQQLSVKGDVLFQGQRNFRSRAAQMGFGDRLVLKTHHQRFGFHGEKFGGVFHPVLVHGVRHGD